MNGNNPQTPHDIALAEAKYKAGPAPRGVSDPDAAEALHNFMDKRNDPARLITEGPGINLDRGAVRACPECANLYVDQEVHDQFHQRLELLQTAALENREARDDQG